MSHEITNLDVVGLNRKQAWHNLGVVIDDDLTAVDAGERFGMFWPVTQYELRAISVIALQNLETAQNLDVPSAANPESALQFYREFVAQLLSVDSHVANVRTKDNDGQSIEHLLGVVGADYSICQNRELAEFTDALSQSGKVVVESCGSIRGGKRVWFLARGESFFVGDQDEIHPYILVSNGHDGAQSIRVTPTTVRVVCSNTLHMVVPNADDSATRPESAAITIRHSGKIADKLEQAKRALRYYGETLQRNRDVFEALQAKQLDREQGLKLFADFYAATWEVATPDELANTNEKIRRTAENRLNRMQKASQVFMDRYEKECNEVGNRNSAWGYFNALTGFIQHDKTARGSDDQARVERRMESNLFGINATRTHDALALALSME